MNRRIPEPAAASSAAPRPSTASVMAAFVAVYLIWGSTYLAIRFAIETLPPFLMAATRFLLAGAMLYLWARRKAVAPDRRHWGSAAIIGGLMLCGGNGGVVWAQQWVPSGLTALLVATVPLWMVLLDALRPEGLRPSVLTVIGLVVGFAGIAILVEPGSSLAADTVPWIPALVLLLAAALWAVGSLASRYLRQAPSQAMATAMQMLTGGALLLLLGLARGEAATVAPHHMSAKSLIGLAYLIFFGSLVAYSAYIWLMRVSTPARVSTYAYVNPIVAVALGWLLAGEALTPRIGLATVLVVAAVVLVTAGRRT